MSFFNRKNHIVIRAEDGAYYVGQHKDYNGPWGNYRPNALRMTSHEAFTLVVALAIYNTSAIALKD